MITAAIWALFWMEAGLQLHVPQHDLDQELLRQLISEAHVAILLGIQPLMDGAATLIDERLNYRTVGR